MIKITLKIILILYILIFSFSFSLNKTNPVFNDLDLEILEKDSINDGDIIKIRITNNTVNKYCLLINKNIFYSKSPTNISHCLKVTLINNNNEELKYILKDDDCYSKKNVTKYLKAPFKLIYLKPKEKIILKKKVVSEIIINKFCWGKYNKNQNCYAIMKLRYCDDLINNKLKDSILKKGYKIFTDSLISNKVPFKFKD